MRWGWRELNPHRPSQNVTGPRFRLNHLAKGAVVELQTRSKGQQYTHGEHTNNIWNRSQFRNEVKELILQLIKEPMSKAQQTQLCSRMSQDNCQVTTGHCKASLADQFPEENAQKSDAACGLPASAALLTEPSPLYEEIYNANMT